MKGTSIYNIFQTMKARCLNPNHKSYHHYGGRGITICDRWLGDNGFENFLKDMGQKPTAHHTLERKDSDGPYSTENCKWATMMEQAKNKRTTRFVVFRGERIHLAEFSRRIGRNHGSIRRHLGKGLSADEVAAIL